MKLINIADMPGFNPASNATGKEQRDVSSGKVYAHRQWKVACMEHGAMNCVNEERTIWRCLTCNVGAYSERVKKPQVKATVERYRYLYGKLIDHRKYNLLSEREQDVISGLAYGATLRELAAEQDVTLQMIQHIRNRVLKKLGQPIINNSGVVRALEEIAKAA